MNRELIENALIALRDTPEQFRTRLQCQIIAALHAELNKPDPEPVGWMVFQGDELLFLHKDKAQAEDWLNRGVSGRTLNPVYL